MTAVARYYDEKTARLLAKYGPGPRVHFHVGVVEEVPPAGASLEALRRGLVRSQERLLEEALGGPFAPALAGHVVDVGCGLGGTLLWLLEHTPAERVTGVTVAATHEAIVRRFAEERRLGDRVHVELRDATALPGERAFDAAVCIEASCYFDRGAWLSSMRRALKPGASLFVLDAFLDDASLGPPFDAYWRTRIGALAEYEAAAAASGFVVEDVTELSARCWRFWEWSLAYTARELERAEADGDEGERARLVRSRDAHALLRDAFRDGGIRYLRLALRAPGA